MTNKPANRLLTLLLKWRLKVVVLAIIEHYKFAAFSALMVRMGLVLVLVAAVNEINAANKTWDGGGANNNWSTANNWNPNGVPASGDALIFAGNIRLINNNDLVGYSFASITFNNTAGAFVLGGNSITLTGAVTNNDANLQTINLNIILNATQTFTTTSGNIEVGGVISGSGGLTKAGATFTLTLNGSNSYTGITTVSAGILDIQNGSALGITSGGTTVTAGASLRLLGGITVGNEALTIAGIGPLSIGALVSHTGNNTWNGTITITGNTEARINSDAAGTTFTLNTTNAITSAINTPLYIDGDGDVHIDGTITIGTGTVRKAGVLGTLYLHGTNTYSGQTIINDGYVSIDAIGNSGNDGPLGKNGTILMGNRNGWNNVVANLIYTGPGETTNKVIDLYGNNVGNDVYIHAEGSGALKFSSAYTATGLASKALYLTGNSSGTIYNEIQNIIVNPSGFTTSLVKSGTSTWVLSGANTYTGGTTITAGTLTLGAAGVLADAGKVILNGGTFSTGATTGYSETVNTLALSDNSTIALGTGVHTLTFAASNGVAWTSGKLLTITGWTGNWDGTGGSIAGKIFVGSTSGGLTTTQLDQIQFYDGTWYFPAKILSTGEVVPDLRTITTGTITGSPFCPGTSGINVPFTYKGKNSFPAGITTFTAQLSNASGSFTTPVILQSVASNASGTQTISATIPAGTPAGTGYRIRVVSDNPAINGSDNGTNLTVSSIVSPYVCYSPLAYIIDMGQPTQTIANGLKPYGLVYALIDTNVAVDWAILPSKAKDGIDFTLPAGAGGKPYKGGSFIIPAELITPAVISIINTWKAKGVVVDGPIATGFTAPLYKSLTIWPRAFLDAKNDDKITPYYTNAEVPKSSYVLNADPTFLPECGSSSGTMDVYILPHADPVDWQPEFITALQNFINNGGSMWAGCHAVSVMEEIPNCNFLTVDSLVNFDRHSDGTTPPPYINNPLSSIPGDPIMQFIGNLDGATKNGSERIYVPGTTGWRTTTKLGVYDDSYTNTVTGITYTYPKAAAVVAYGRAFGDDTKGVIMYEAGHSLENGSIPEKVAAQRAFFNFLLQAGGQPQTIITPPIIANQTTTTCSGITFSVTPAGAPLNTTYTWLAPTGSGFTGGAAQTIPQPSISGTLYDITAVPVTAIYTVTPAIGGCVGSPFTLTVTVNPAPFIPAQTAAICSGGTFTVTPVNNPPTTIVPVGTTYSWGVPVYSPPGSITGGIAQSGQPSISGTLTNITINPATATYSVTPTSGAAGVCVGATFTVTVTVNPTPIVTANATPSSICLGKTSNLTSSSNIVILPSVLLSENFNAGTNNWTKINNSTGGTPANAAWTLRPDGYDPNCYENSPAFHSNDNSQFYQSSSCAQGNGTTATILQSPVISTVGYSSLSLDFYHFYRHWNGSGTVQVSTNGSTWTNVATYMSDQGAFAAFAHPTINLNSYINNSTFYIRFNYNASYGWYWSIDNVTVSGTSTPPAVSWTSVPPGYSSNVPNPPVPVAPTVTTTYIVTYTDPNTLCSGSASATVTVNPVPVIPAQTTTICSGGTFTVTPVNNPPGTIVPPGTTYTWGMPVYNPLGSITGGGAQPIGQASISQTLTNLTSSPATATYTVTPTAGTCAGATFTVTVTVNPKPVIPAQTATICGGGTFTVTPVNNPPTTIVPAGTTYTWGMPVYNPLGSITGGSAQPIGQASISQTLNNLTSSPATATYTVTPTSGAAGSCVGSTFTVTVNVNPTPVIPAQTATICSGNSFTVTPVNNPPTTIVPTGTTYIWGMPVYNPPGSITGGSAQAIGQTSISQTLTNLTNSPATATYTITPTSGAAGSCVGAAFTVTVTVNPTPVIPAQTATICSGNSFTVNPVNNPPTTIVPAGTTYTWGMPVYNPPGSITGGSAQPIGQPAISQTLTNITSSPATVTYTVTPTSGAAGSCVGVTFTVTVTVNPLPVVAITGSPTICINGTTTLSPTSGGTWISNNPAVASVTNAGVVTGLSAGIATFTFTDGTTGCSNTTSEVTVTPCAPEIDCPNDTLVYADVNCIALLDPGVPDTISGTPPFTWKWTMTGATIANGTSNPIEPIPYPFNLDTTYITWIATNIAGADTCQQRIIVVDTVRPTFNAPGPLEFCVYEIDTATYNGLPEPDADIVPDRPDWYIINGTYELDLLNIHDNCCIADSLIHWIINFTGTPAHPPLIGTGQPSDYGPITLWGTNDYTVVVNTITYMVEDCYGNLSAPVTVNITMKPRPNVIKVY